MACNSEDIPNSKKAVKKVINLILLGKTGSGKSSTGNTIIQRKEFTPSSNKVPKTEFGQLECFENDDFLVKVVDTPGLMGTTLSTKEILQRISDARSLCPEGFSAIIYVMDYGERYKEEDKKTQEILNETFGREFLKKFCIVIMTKGDQFDMQMEQLPQPLSFNEWLSQQTKPTEFVKLLSDCNKRVVLFYNIGNRFAREKEQSRDNLFTIINSMSGMYTDEHFQQCAEQRKKLVTKLKSEYQIQFVQEDLSLIKQTISNSKLLIDSLCYYEEPKALKDEIEKLKNQVEILLTKMFKEDMKAETLQKIQKRIFLLWDEVKNSKVFKKNEWVDQLDAIRLEIDGIKHSKSHLIYNGFGLVKKVFLGGAIGAAGGCGVGAAAGTAASISAAGQFVAMALTGPVAIVGVAGTVAGAGMAYYYFKDK